METVLKQIVAPLLEWFYQNQRDLPWRKTKNPYCIWISEIMLQQTRVEAVKEYYKRFLTRFPDVFSLASAKEEEVLKYWEGLGYYSRARNLHRAAKIICEQWNGEMPTKEKELRTLPGIGPYTAGAIASIAFEEPAPAVDGNVLRVLSRILASERPIDDQKVKKELTESLAKVYPENSRGDFTQSLMELGAIVCIPNGEPLCDNCPLLFCCCAKKENKTDLIPVITPKKKRKKEEKTVFLIRCNEKMAYRKRLETGLLANLWELPNAEGHLDIDAAMEWLEQNGILVHAIQKGRKKKHIFTHIEWYMESYEVICEDFSEEFIWADEKERAKEIALPTAFKQFLV